MYQILGIIATVIGIYSWILIIYILMSWVPSSRSSSIGQLFTKVCEPFLEPFRRIIPPIGMMDFSPIVAIIVLRLAESGVGQLQYML